jgi:GAF domain-containing protein
MQRLAPATRQVLELGACIGHQFDLSTLATIHERSPEETAADLWEALREGLVVPLDTHYRLLLASEGSLPGQELQASYRFLHDRVQQAAYSLIPDDRKQEVHLKIGRLIQAQIEGDPSADDLFKVVSHKNRAAARIDDRQEQLELLRFNLAVGRRAKASMAYAAAAEHFQMGMALLGARSWEEDHALSFALHRERAECEWLSGAAAQAQTLIQELLSHAQSRLERAEVYSLRLAVHTLLGEFAEVLRIGRESVALFGVELPETPEQTYAALGAALAEVPANLAGRRIEQLVDAPWVGDADQLAILRLLAAMLPGTYTLDPTLLGLIAVIQVNLSLKYGNSPAAAFAYGMYCLLLAGAMGRYDEAREFQKVSLQLNERPDGVELQCKVYVVCGAPAHFFESTRAALMCLARGQQAGLTSGDFSFASYCCLNITVMKLSAGDALGPLGEEVRDFLALMQRTKDPFTTPVLVLAKQMLASLTGSTSGPQSLSDAAFDEAAFVAGLAPALQLARCWYYVNKLVLAVLYGDHAGALSMAAQADALGASAMSQFFLNDIPFYASLALLALCDTATEEVRARHIEAAEDHRAKLTIWAQHAPENYAHKERLVGAEMARVRGHDAEAAALYDQAIVAARASGFTHQEALAGELCARFYLRKGRETIAQWYLVDAHRAYGRWGATAKAEHLAREHARLLEGVSTEEPRTRVLATTVTRRGSTEAFDVATVVRAMQAVASENVLDKLLDRLMRSLITNAGAQRGVLILAREGELVIEASMRVDPDTVETGLSIPALASQDIATSVVQLVARTREPVVLNDARQDSRFAGDAYIAARQPRSILCLAMTHQGRLAGILYLENNVTQGAFTPGRVEVCGLLASQAAIALENALLIASIREGTRALRDSNEQLQRELELRAASEAERELLQQEIMRLQTPIIPITDEVLVMPLVGALDAGRAQQVLETALTGVKNRRAKVVILDITGVVGVDAGVAAALINTARALQLLGAKAVLSGIRPEVAVSLVQLDVQLGSIVTMSTLQSGIAYALGPGGLQGSFRR